MRRGLEFRATTVALDPESTLVLYTDGLIERRAIATDERLAALLDAATASCHEPPATMCAALRDTLRDERREDDATVLTLRLRA